MVFDMLKLLILGVLCCYGRGDVMSIRYPSNNPCILIDIDAEFQLVWTDKNGKEHTVPDFTLSGTTIAGGICAKESPSPQVLSKWSGVGIFAFSFEIQSDTILYAWNMSYSPNRVFTNNNQTAMVSHSANLGRGTYQKAFACQHVPVVGNTRKMPGMNEYQMTITIKSIKAQGFNVNDGKFSEAANCPADLQSTSSASPTFTSRNSSKPTSATTKPTKATYNSTTGPTKSPISTTKRSTVPTPPTTPITPPAPNAHAKQTFEVYDVDQQCVLMQGEFLFTLVYPKNDNTKGFVDIGLQEIRSVSGTCLANNNSENIVRVEFYDGWMVMITISKKRSPGLPKVHSDSNTQYFWSRLYLRYSYATELGGKPLFPNVETHTTAPELNVSLADGTYEASTDGSFICNSNQNIDLMGGNTLQTWNLQYGAFRTTNHTTFSDKNIKECFENTTIEDSKDSQINNLIAIAAGGVLAAIWLSLSCFII